MWCRIGYFRVSYTEKKSFQVRQFQILGLLLSLWLECFICSNLKILYCIKRSLNSYLCKAEIPEVSCLKPNSSLAVTVVFYDRRAGSAGLTMAGVTLCWQNQAPGHVLNSFLSSAELARGERCRSPTHRQCQGLTKPLLSLSPGLGWGDSWQAREVKAATLLLLVIKSDPLVPFALWKKGQFVKCSWLLSALLCSQLPWWEKDS